MDGQPQVNPQQQWVPVPTGEPAPVPKKPLPSWLRMVLVILMTLVGLGLIALFIWGAFLRGGRQAEVARDELAAAIADCRANAPDVDACIRNAAMRLAQQNGDAQFCDSYEGDEKDDCVMLAAVSARDQSLCHGVVNDEKEQNCRDAVTALTIQSSSPEECAEYTDETLRNRCVDAAVRSAAIAGDCEVSGVTTELCDAGAVIREAEARRDPGLCSQIIGDLYDACIERVGEPDVDLDGLSADDERLYGTSDQDSDTDDDGFDDKTEIENGFDPLS